MNRSQQKCSSKKIERESNGKQKSNMRTCDMEMRRALDYNIEQLKKRDKITFDMLTKSCTIN